jgi:hypothetical protein
MIFDNSIPVKILRGGSPDPPRLSRFRGGKPDQCAAGQETRRARSRHLAALALMLVALLVGCTHTPPPTPPTPAADQPQRLPTATISIGDRTLTVEVAKEPAEQQKGMMFRPHLAPDEAMLFVFPREDNLSFWMKNTYVDLDIAYIRADGVITQIERLKAHDLTAVYSREPARFALEVPAGWFAAHGITVGAKAIIPPEVAAP